jgi:hypothetical protein
MTEQPMYPMDGQAPRIDMSGYQREMSMSTAATLGLMNTLTALQKKMDGTAKRAGNRMLGAGIGTLGILAADVAVYAKYEQELSKIQATTKILTRSGGDFKKQMTDQVKGIDQLSRALPVSRTELTKMYGVLKEMGVNSPRMLKQTTDQLVKLGAVTGESPADLGRGVMQLTRQMGVDGAGFLDKYSGALANVTAQQGVTAQGTLNFAQSIAPFTRAVGISTTDTLGFAAAFEKAGADGFAASSTFSGMLSDINRQIEYGSPELAKYANLIGKSTDEFAKMDKAEAVVQIFEAINDQGSDAIKTLDRFGYDGIRAAKAITQVSQSAGGLRAALSQAREGAGDKGLVDQAAAEAMGGINDQAAKLANTIEEIAKIWGSSVAPIFETGLKAMTAMAEAAANLSKLFAPIMGPVAAGSALALVVGGTLLKAYKAATIAATALYVGRSTIGQGVVSGVMAGRAAGTNRQLPAFARGWEQAAANGGLRPWQQQVWNTGVGVGSRFQPGGTGSNAMGMVARGSMAVPTWWWNTAAQGYRDARLPGYMRDSMIGGGQKVGQGAGGVPMIFGRMGQAVQTVKERIGQEAQAVKQMTPQQMGQSYQRMMERRTQEAIGAHMAQGMPGRTDAEKALMQQQKSAADVTRTWSGHMKSANDQTKTFGSRVAGMGAALSRAVGQAAGTTAAAGGGMLMKAGSAMGGLPMGIMAGAMVGGAIYSKMQSTAKEDGTQSAKLSYTFEGYDEALGRSTEGLSSFEQALKAAEKALPKPDTIDQAKIVTREDINFAQANRDFNTPEVGGLQTTDQAKAWLASQKDSLDPERLDLIKRDLLRNKNFNGDDVQSILTGYDSMSVDEGKAKLQESYTQPWAKGWGLGDEQKDRLGLMVGGLQADWMKTSEEQGIGAANQNRFADAVDMLAKTAEKGDTKEMDALVSRLVDEGVVPKGFEGRDVQERTAWQDEYAGKDVKDYRSAAIEEWRQAKPGEVDAMNTGTAQEMAAAAAEKAAADASEKLIVSSRIRTGSALGNFSQDNKDVQAAVDKPGDPQLQYAGITAMSKEAVKVAGSFADAEREIRKHQAAIEDVTSEEYKLAESARQLVKQQKDLERQSFSREGQVGALASDYTAQLNMPVAERGPTYVQDTEESRQAYEQGKEGYRQYLAQMNMAFKQYERQTARAEADFYRNRQYQAEDYHRNVRRATEDFHRQMQYAEEDFNLSRERAQRDFNIAAQRMAEDSAKSIYDPYQRAQSQYSYGAASLLTNLNEQTQLMKDQASNVNKLSKMGLSDDAINQLQLNDPKNRQQAQRLAEQMATDPSMVDKFNKSIEGRLDASKGLTMNKSSDAWKRMNEDFQKSAKDAEEDFDKSMKRSRTAFQLQLKRGQEDFATALERQNEAYNLSMTRAKEDLAFMAEQVYGSFATLAGDAISWITKNMPGIGDEAIKQIQRVADFVAGVDNAPGAPGVGDKGNPGVGGKKGRAPNQGNRVPEAAEGLIFTQPTLALVAEAGFKEAAIPLSPTGANFMTEMVAMVVKQYSARGVPVTGGGGNTFVDQSQKISGVTVMASDPDEMGRKLQEKQRRRALVRPRAAR